MGSSGNYCRVTGVLNQMLKLAALGLIAVAALAADPQLTIYNQNFAVVRELIPLDLKAGRNQIEFAGATAHVEPDSVILRDSAGRVALQVLEQNYRNDPISQELLLSLFEGKTVQFEVREPNGGTRLVEGKILRSGYAPHYGAFQRYGPLYSNNQMAMAGGGAGQPLIEIGGQLRFGLPGTPMFPTLPTDTILKPTLNWILKAPQPAKVMAELSYVSGGMSWQADYNLVAKEGSERLDLTGWVTMDNQSGKQFDGVKIQLMAGDVQKLQAGGVGGVVGGIAGGGPSAAITMPPPVTERTFDDYHLYTLQNATTLRDRETKQVEFVRAGNVDGRRKYVYDGFRLLNQQQYLYWNPDQFRQNADFGTQVNPKVWVMREFDNTKANQLGVPLPKGRVRFYTQDKEGRLQFVGENVIDHTPQGEKISVYAGNAFDLVGDRKRTEYRIDMARREIDETFEITVTNRKSEAAEVDVTEHLYRGQNWQLVGPSDPFRTVNSNLIVFTVQLKPDEVRKVTYRVHYTW